MKEKTLRLVTVMSVSYSRRYDLGRETWLQAWRSRRCGIHPVHTAANTTSSAAGSVCTVATLRELSAPSQAHSYTTHTWAQAVFNLSMYTVFRKKHPLTFSFISRELFVDLNKNCSEYTQGLIDSNNIKIRYSLRSMT